MRKSKKIKYSLYTIALLSAIVIAIAFELFFNYRALRSEHSKFDVSDDISYVELEDSSYVQVLDVTYNRSHYINKLRIKGEFPDSYFINIELHKINGFGKEETIYIKTTNESIKDSDIYMPIQEKVIAYKVFVNANDSDFEVEKIIEINDFHFNGSRFLLVLVLVFLLELLLPFFDLEKNILVIFIIASLGFGSAIIFSSGIKKSTWDEEAHFKTVFELSSDKKVDWNVAAWRVTQKDIPAYDTYEERAQTEEFMNSQSNEHKYYIDRGYYTVPFNYVISYMPMATGFKLGTILGLPFTVCYTMAKYASLLVCTTLIAISIYLSKNRKLFIAAISLMPTVLFQSSMITYDGMVYSFITLGLVLIDNEIQDKKSTVNSSNLMWATVLIVLGAIAKAIYIPLLLFLFFVPKSKFGNKKYNILFSASTILVFLIVMSTFVLPTLSNAVAGNTDFGGDYRGGDTGAARQLISLVKHPISAVKLFFTNIFAFDNLRNLGTPEYDNYMFTTLMFLNHGYYGAFNDKWNMLLLPILCILFLRDEKTNGFKYSVKQKIAMAVIIFVIVGMIWGALYLSFTVVGAEHISGVQARYYIPLLLPLMFITRNNLISIDIKKISIDKIMFGIIFYLEFYGIYNNIILGNCI